MQNGFVFDQSITYKEWFNYKLPSLFTKRPYATWHLIALFMAIGLVANISRQKEDVNTFLLGLQIISIFIWLYNVYVFFWWVKANYTRAYFMNQPTNIEISALGLRHKNPDIDVLFAWHLFKRINEDKAFVVLELKHSESILLKKDSIQTRNDIAALLQFLRSQVNNNPS